MTLIYFPNVTVHTFQERCNNNMMLQKVPDEIFFYTSTGIFTLRNNQICKQIYKSKQIETIKHDDIVLYKDNSEIAYKEIYSQLPCDYNTVRFKKEIYRFKQHDVVAFVIVFKDNIIYDCYMETYENIDTSAIVSSAVSFLSC